jgi:hypothetical protein
VPNGPETALQPIGKINALGSDGKVVHISGPVWATKDRDSRLSILSTFKFPPWPDPEVSRRDSTLGSRKLKSSYPGLELEGAFRTSRTHHGGTTPSRTERGWPDFQRKFDKSHVICERFCEACRRPIPDPEGEKIHRSYCCWMAVSVPRDGSSLFAP